MVSSPKNLSEQATLLLTDSENQIYLSAISVWELLIKYEKGFLKLNELPQFYVPKYRVLHRIESLPFCEEATFQLHKLPWHHKDPFDRMLVSQAISHHMAIVTPDILIQQYPIQAFW